MPAKIRFPEMAIEELIAKAGESDKPLYLGSAGRPEIVVRAVGRKLDPEPVLNKAHPDYRFPEDDGPVYYTHHLEGCLVFVDGSNLRFEVALGLNEKYDIGEKRYFCGYYDRGGTRVFQYDNSPHRPELTSYPHHVHRGPRPREGKDSSASEILRCAQNDGSYPSTGP